MSCYMNNTTQPKKKTDAIPKKQIEDMGVNGKIFRASYIAEFHRFHLTLAA